MAMNEQDLMAMQQQDPQRMADQQNMAAGDPENQIPPEMMAEMMAGGGGMPTDGGQMPEGEMPMDPSMMGMGEEGPPMPGMDEEADGSMADDLFMEEGANAVPDELMGDVPDHMDPLKMMILDYIDFASGVKEDNQLNIPVKAEILQKMSQAVATLIPLVSNDQEMELQTKQFELQLKAQEHQMNMEMKQMEMQMKQQEHEMKLQFDRESNQQKLQLQQQQSQMQLQQQQENHRSKLVQGQESHKSKMDQQKQAAQLKQSNNPGK